MGTILILRGEYDSGIKKENGNSNPIPGITFILSIPIYPQLPVFFPTVGVIFVASPILRTR